MKVMLMLTAPLHFQQQFLICLITCYRTKHSSRKIASPWVCESSSTESLGHKDVKSKHTNPHPCIFLTLKRNYSVKDVGMDKALYIYIHFYIFPSLFFFWHAIGTSFRDVLICLIFSVTCEMNTISSATTTPEQLIIVHITPTCTVMCGDTGLCVWLPGQLML